MDAAEVRARYDALIADEHDDPECTCEHCDRDRARDEARALAREARVRGGLFPLARELFGASLLPLEEQTRGTPMEVAQLAQASLGDVFETVNRIGESGREKCRPRFHTEPPAAHPAELIALIDFLEELVNTARAHLHYMPKCAFTISQRVVFVGDGGVDVEGFFAGATRDGKARIRLADDASGGAGYEYAEIPFTSVRPGKPVAV